MSKRVRPVEKKLRAEIALPSDVIDLFTSFLDVQGDTATLFCFMLVCKQWSAVAVQTMVHWYATLFDAKGKYQPGDRMDGLTRDYNTHYGINGFTLPRPAETTAEFCVAHYHHWHMAQLVRAWGLVLPEILHRPREDVIHTNFALKGLEVRDAFYWDAEKNAFQPLKSLPALRTVDMPLDQDDMLALVEKDLATQLSLEPEAQRPLTRLKNKLVMSGLRRCAVEKLRSTVVTLLGDKLASHKPHKSTPLRNAVLEGKHLLQRKVHKPLQLYIHRLRSLSVKKRAAILTLKRAGPAVASRIAARRNTALPPQTIDLVSELPGLELVYHYSPTPEGMIRTFEMVRV